MTDLIAAVRAEHRRILAANELLRRRYGAFPFDRRRARDAVHRLTRLESRHEMAEAAILWPVVRDLLPEYHAWKQAAAQQEKALAHQLRSLHRAAGSASSTELAEATVRAVRIHVGLEESEVLPALAATISANDSARLGRAYREMSARGPTRPHPHVPRIPGILTATVPVVRRVDRFRDLFGLA